MRWLSFFKSLFSSDEIKRIDGVVYEKNGIKAMKIDGFPTIIQAGKSSIVMLDAVIDDQRLRKLSETDDEYNERMRLLDEQENKCKL